MAQLTAEAAREIIAEIYEQTTGEALQIHTVEAWASEWLEGKKSGSAGTFAKYSATIKSFLWSPVIARKRRSLKSSKAMWRNFAVSAGARGLPLGR
jgi:hypothetical protein